MAAADTSNRTFNAVLSLASHRRPLGFFSLFASQPFAAVIAPERGKNQSQRRGPQHAKHSAGNNGGPNREEAGYDPSFGVAQHRPGHIADHLNARKPSPQMVENGLVPDGHAKQSAHHVRGAR